MKFLIIGLGGIGQRHLRNLRALLGKEVEISGQDLRPNPPVLTDQLQIDPGSSLQEAYNLPLFLDLEQALAQKPDVVFVCNPSSLHIPAAIRAAQAGCHLFIEKPLSNNLNQLDELFDLVESRSLKAVVGYQMRFHPCLRRLRELVLERKVGRILSVRAEVGEYMPGWHTYEDYRQIYAARQDLGGGVILSQIHELDYLYWLFGLPRSIYTVGGHLSNLDIDVEDTADTLMECELDGRPVPVTLHQDYLQRPLSRFCEVIGESGKIRMDLRELKVDVFDDKGKQVKASSYEGFQRNQLFLDELKSFLGCLEGKETQIVGLRAGAQSLRMALAAKESLAEGKVVKLTR
jgi:predicted dehydrogenase